MTGERALVAELAGLLERHFGGDLAALYLYGSLTAGGFRPGKSDVDLFAVLERDVTEGEQLEALRALHDGLVRRHPDWVERVEVAYVGRGVLQTFGSDPAGAIAVISPGEPLNVHESDPGWLVNWRAVRETGETLRGPAPAEVGPVVTDAAYRRALEARLRDWVADVRRPAVAYVPAHQGYIVATVCRALYSLETGRQASKQEAVDWAAARLPEQAAFIREAFGRYLADVGPAHRATIAFVDRVAGEAGLSDASR